jgi:hypothetical protein
MAGPTVPTKATAASAKKIGATRIGIARTAQAEIFVTTRMIPTLF